MDIDHLQSEMKFCRKCTGIFAGRFADPIAKLHPLRVKPIFAGATSAPVMLIGQAPGITEYQSGKAFQGQAGSEIREILASVGLPTSSFDAVVYQTSVTKCFPGRKIVKRRDRRTGEETFNEEDRVPSVTEVKNCLPFLEQQIALLKPKVIVLLGRMAIDGYLRLRLRRFNGSLQNYVGRLETWNGASIIFFPHTSGTSRWLNSVDNRHRFSEAKQVLAGALKGRGIVA